MQVRFGRKGVSQRQDGRAGFGTRGSQRDRLTRVRMGIRCWEGGQGWAGSRIAGFVGWAMT